MIKKLKDIAVLTPGHAFRKKIEYGLNEKNGLLDTSHFTSSDSVYINSEDVRKIKITGLKKQEIIKPNDIIFKAKGLINNAFVIKKVPRNVTVTSAHIIIRVTDKNILPEYLCMYLNGFYAQKYFLKSSPKTAGLSIKNITKPVLSELPVNAVSLKKQRFAAELNELFKEQFFLQKEILDKTEILRRKITETLLAGFFG